MNSKKIISLLASIAIFSISMNSGLKAADECFEGLSRSIFKFNMAFDNAILEPIAKGYNKLPDLLKMVQVILLLILQHYFQFRILFYKEIWVE